MQNRDHVVLVGPMGSGKSTLGRALAARLARPFVDVDARIEADAGCSIAALFAGLLLAGGVVIAAATGNQQNRGRPNGGTGLEKLESVHGDGRPSLWMESGGPIPCNPS